MLCKSFLLINTLKIGLRIIRKNEKGVTYVFVYLGTPGSGIVYNGDYGLRTLYTSLDI
jgi:hypothetical protein